VGNFHRKKGVGGKAYCAEISVIEIEPHEGGTEKPEISSASAEGVGQKGGDRTSGEGLLPPSANLRGGEAFP